MSDQIKVSQAIGQAEYLEPDKLKASQAIGQAEYLEPDKLKASQAIGQVEISTLPSGIYVGQVLAQVEYAVQITEGPAQEKLLRHGTWFGGGAKQRMWFAR